MIDSPTLGGKLSWCRPDISSLMINPKIITHFDQQTPILNCTVVLLLVAGMEGPAYQADFLNFLLISLGKA